MKVFSLSNRFYYREFPDLKNIILHDLRVYNRVLHKAYKCLYDRAYDFGYKIIFLLEIEDIFCTVAGQI